MVKIKVPAVAAEEQLHQVADEAPDFDAVQWTKDPGLRKLYILCCLGLMVASATTGYDG
jgi:hypothetical protein